MLSEQVDKLTQNYTQQVSSTDMKDQQLKELLDELQELKYKLDEIQNERPATMTRERVVYRRDTVYVKQVEYVTKMETPIVIADVDELQMENEDESMHVQNAVVQHAIYPGNNKYTADQRTEKVRVRFGNLGAKSN